MVHGFWWQQRWRFSFGLIGGLAMWLEAPIATLIWPEYDWVRMPVLMLTAQGAPHEWFFSIYEVMIGMIIAIYLGTLIRWHVFEREKQLSRIVTIFFWFWLFGLAFRIMWPEETVADSILGDPMSPRYLMEGVVGTILGVIAYRYGALISHGRRRHLGLVVMICAVFFVLFELASVALPIMGWSKDGLMDVLAFDCLALAFMAGSIYYIRLIGRLEKDE